VAAELEMIDVSASKLRPGTHLSQTSEVKIIAAQKFPSEFSNTQHVPPSILKDRKVSLQIEQVDDKN